MAVPDWNFVNGNSELQYDKRSDQCQALKPSDPLASRFQCIFYDHSARPWVIHRDIGTVSLRSFGLPPADCKSNQFRNASDFKLLLDVHTVYFRRFNADAHFLSDLFRGSPFAG